jgi:hypothetical protein
MQLLSRKIQSSIGRVIQHKHLPDYSLDFARQNFDVSNQIRDSPNGESGDTGRLPYAGMSADQVRAV